MNNRFASVFAASFVFVFVFHLRYFDSKYTKKQQINVFPTVSERLNQICNDIASSFADKTLIKKKIYIYIY